VRIDHLEAQAARAQVLKTELARVDADLAAAHEERDTLARRESEIAALRSERDALQKKAPGLRVARGIEEAVERDAAALAEAREALARAKKALDAATADATAQSAALDALAADLASRDARAERYTVASASVERLRRLSVLSMDLAGARDAARVHEAAVKSTDERLAENERDAAIALAEKADLEAARERARLGGEAALLASRLKPGEPCPVCGSTAHPAPARGAAEAFTENERIEAAERRVDSLRKKATELAAVRAAREADAKNARARATALIADYCALGPSTPGDPCILPDEVPSEDEAKRLLAEASRVLEEAAREHVAAQKAGKEAESLRAALAACERRRAEAQEAHAARASEAAALRATHDRGKEQLRAACATRPEARPRERSRRRRHRRAAEALEACETRIRSLRRGDQCFRRAVPPRRAFPRRPRREARRTRTDPRRSVRARERGGLGLAESLRAAGFPSAAEARVALLAPDEATARERAVRAHDDETAATARSLSELEAALAEWSGPAADEAERALAELGSREADTSRELEAANARLIASTPRRPNGTRSPPRGGTLARVGARRPARGRPHRREPLKCPFDAWVLGMYLEEITAYANERLVRMSEGRYRIQLNDAYRRGNSLAGLDLEILDAYTGRARPAGTLSGGESFMASISLALGLADSIQARSGGVQLDAVFIDEGFGSLDEASLERAIAILDEIRGQRTVGIVSHVAELRSRIPNRLEVVKTGAGSAIRKET
jgi:exonuclease SbcC